MFTLNRLPSYGQPLAADDAAYLDLQAATQIEALLRLCPAHAPTRLHELPALAGQLQVRRLFVKDESTRLGLGSFKALGGAYAVLRVLLEHAELVLGRRVAPEDLAQPQVRSLASGFTVACATDGNHGRSVAAGARFVGCRAIIFIHGGVSDERAQAIANLGAEVRRVPGSYDDSVATAAREAATHGWTVVSDTSWPGYERIPLLVAQGYTAMVREVLNEIPVAASHVFIQAGVGGVASAIAAHLALTCGPQRPRIVVVEPSRAACLFASHEAGKRIAIAAGEPTVMAMLECYEPSLTAWRVLEKIADAFMTVDEDDAAGAMRQLARPLGADPAIVAGESGGAGLAGLRVAADSAARREALQLTNQSVVLLFNTEGATDARSYKRLTGCEPTEVAAPSAPVD